MMNIATHFKALFLRFSREKAFLNRQRNRYENPIFHYDRAGLKSAPTRLPTNHTLSLQIVIQTEFAGMMFKNEQRLLPLPKPPMYDEAGERNLPFPL